MVQLTNKPAHNTCDVALPPHRPHHKHTPRSLQVDAGVTLTIAAQPRLWCGQRWMFSGDGSVVFSAGEGARVDVLPLWWKAPGVLDWAPGVQAAADACAGGGGGNAAKCTMLLTQPMSLGQVSGAARGRGVVRRDQFTASPLACRLCSSGPAPRCAAARRRRSTWLAVRAAWTALCSTLATTAAASCSSTCCATLGSQ